MTDHVKFTHKGLFCGIVPVYVGGIGEDVMDLKERHWVFVPLFIICEWILGLLAFLISILGYQTDAAPVLITGKLPSPRYLVVD